MDTSHTPSWKEMRVMSHVMMTGGLGKETQPIDVTLMPGWENLDTGHRERAATWHGLAPYFAQLGILPGELRLSIEPIHPLSPEQLSEFLESRLSALGVAPPYDSYGLTAISRSMINSYVPVVDYFDGGEVPSDVDLFLYDALTGFVIWEEKGRVRNFWLGNKVDLMKYALLSRSMRELVIRSSRDHFSIGASLFLRVISPHLKRARKVTFDQGNVPTLIVEDQKDLDELANDLVNATSNFPGLKIAFRGQTSEHHLPDRSHLVAKGVCEYSDARDHSLVPSLYRSYDGMLKEPSEFKSLVGHLFEWNLWSDLVFGDPAQYVDLLGRPYVPTHPEGFRTAAMCMGGNGSENPIFKDMGPYSIFTTRDGDGKILEQYVKLNRPGFDTIRRNLVLQHYGAPTPLVDVTTDMRIAEWFALNKLKVDEKTGVTSSSHIKGPLDAPVIYVFLFLEELTPFVETQHLVTPSESLRPHRQACAVLGGAGNLYRNAASRFIGAKVKFAPSFVPRGLPDAGYLFPGPDDDATLKHLLSHYRVNKGLSRQFPVYYFPTS